MGKLKRTYGNINTIMELQDLNVMAWEFKEYWKAKLGEATEIIENNP